MHRATLRGCLLGLLMMTAAVADAASLPPPYAMQGTEQRRFESPSLHRAYPIFVGLPASYATHPERKYPLVLVVDADAQFPLARSLADAVGNDGEWLQDFILVGVGYSEGDSPLASRRRDFTPTVPQRLRTAVNPPSPLPAFGESAGYRRFLADELLPWLEREYRIDPHERSFFGYSLGGLLGADILLADPGLFRHYLLGSPSLWFDDKEMFRREERYAAQHEDLVADVFLTAGEFESPQADSDNPRRPKDTDIRADMLAFSRRLATRHYRGLRLQTQVLVGEDHLTGLATCLSRGLLWALAPPATAPLWRHDIVPGP